MRPLLALGIGALLVVLSTAAQASSNHSISGAWRVELQDDKRTLVGDLDIEKVNGVWKAYLEGGPVRIEVDDHNVTLWADSRDVRGFVFERKLAGRVLGDVMSGRYTQEGAAAQKEEGGPWRARRRMPRSDTPAPPEPVDLTGTWTATQELDFRKYSMSLTDAGKAWLEEYMPYYDQPDVRCASIGLPALATYTFPFEILGSPERLTFIYEYQSRVRRVWLDERQPGPAMPPSRMGHSNAYWDGSTLVVNTKLLDRTIRDFRGELISEDAMIEERYSLSEDGSTLSAVIIVHDPQNYARPPIRRRRWVRNNKAEIFPYTCDPDSFYLTMYEDGELEMYKQRADKRF